MIKKAKVENIENENKDIEKEVLKKDYKENDNSFIKSITGFILGAVFTILLIRYTNILDNKTAVVVTKNKTQVYEKTSLAASVDKIYDATVLVSVYKDSQEVSTGSGFVYKVDANYGYILTNEHVVSKGNKAILTMCNDKKVDGEILGNDSYLDLAVIKIKRTDVVGIANIGKSEISKLGDTIFTVGAPMGKDYRGTVTGGILSGKDRMVSVSVNNGISEDWVMKVLQIDASINPGNSGGPLLNANGEVIGIVSMKLVDEKVEGMGFAIPIEYAMSHIESLENKKDIKWPVLGVSMFNVSDKVTGYKYGMKAPKNITSGVVVAEISSGSSAEHKLKVGDIITKIDGKEVENIARLRYELYKHQAGDEISITYIREGKESNIKVKLSGK